MDQLNSPIFFGDWVKRRRKALDLTQEQLANRASCSKHAVRKIESGERRPSRQLAELLANALDLPPEEKPQFIKVARGETNLERLSSPLLESSFTSSLDLQPPTQQSRIPLQPKPVIGRESELASMENLFNNPVCRLLTLTGMGGIGKTSLAIEFATRHQNLFSAGVFYVPLASIKSTEAIVPAIAEALGFVFSGPNDPKEQLINYFGSHLVQPVLLVLDNLEHLLVEPPFQAKVSVGQLISELLQSLQNIKILATSREHLNLRGEWTYELHGLPVPPLEFEGDLDEFSAAELFIQNARRIKLDFTAVEDERLALIRICRLLDGIPLAIELAAVWVGMLSCQEIAHEIESNIDFLTTTMRDIPERHRSIRASFDHSWNLLSDTEQQVLSNLSIFHGSFNRYAAEKIAGASLTVLASLVSKSLVRRTSDGQYDLHEAIRQYALSHLDQNPTRCFDICNLHCEHYLKFISSYERALKSAEQQEAMRELSKSLDNIRAAWKWAIKQRNFELIGDSLRSVGWFFEVVGLLHEGIDRLEPVIQIMKAGPESDLRNKILGSALLHQGLLYFRKGQFKLAQELYEQSISILRKINVGSLLADALIFLGTILHLNGEYTRSKVLVEEGLRYAQETKDPWFTAFGIYTLGHIASLTGEYSKGYEQMLVGINLWRSLGDPHSISLGLNFLVPTLIQLKHYDEAKSNMHESIDLCEKTKNRWGMGTTYRYLGLATMAAGDYIEAQAHFTKSLEIFGEYFEGWDIAQSLTYFGDSVRLAGNLNKAREIYLDALRISIDSYSVPIAMESLLGLACLELQEGNPEYTLEISYCVMHHPSITQDVRDHAIEIHAKARSLLTEPQIQEIIRIAQSRTMEEITATFNPGDMNRSQ